MESNRLVFIRTDANSEIASGHMFRCLSIADALIRFGASVIFLFSDERSLSLFHTISKDDGIKYQILENAEYNNLEKELPSLLKTITSFTKNSQCSFLLDSYFANQEYISSIEKIIPVAYIDDFISDNFKCSLVINYDVYFESPSTLYTNATKALLGGMYAPLREDFSKNIRKLSPLSKTVLVLSGSSDPFDFCSKFISNIVVKHPNLYFTIVVGFHNSNGPKIKDMAKQLCNVSIVENCTNLVNYMADSDLAISAGGTTLFELCAVGVPTASFSMSDNQIESATAFANCGAIPYMGDIRKDETNLFDNISVWISESEYAKRKTTQTKLRSLVDGKGSERIAKELLAL